MPHARRLVALAAVAAAVWAPSAASGPGRLHIHELRGSVGSYVYGGGPDLLALRLRATVCFRSLAEARRMYPDEIEVTHFAVFRKQKLWRRARTAIDRSPWLVPFGENWRGGCGPVWVHDPIPPTHYGVESLGNPNACYGVALRIKAAGLNARKRAIIQCPFRSVRRS